MIRSNGRNNAPYALLSATLLGCACFFAAMLWQGGNARTPRTNLTDYVPNFSVQADVVRVVRVVPLARHRRPGRGGGAVGSPLS